MLPKLLDRLNAQDNDANVNTAEVEDFKAHSEWCQEKAQDVSHHQQETFHADIASTKAAIEDDAAQVQSSGPGVASLITGIAASDAELATAEAVCKKGADYSKSEAK